MSPDVGQDEKLVFFKKKIVIIGYLDFSIRLLKTGSNLLTESGWFNSHLTTG